MARGDGGFGLVLHLLRRHAELLLHVDLRRRDEHVDARLVGVAHGFPRPVDVLEPGTREAGDDGTVHGLGDRLDGLEVTVGRDREPGLDDVDAQARELVRDLELLGDVERDAGRLLAVPQRRVEDLDNIHLALRGVVSLQRKTPRPDRHGGRSASTYECPRYIRRRPSSVCGSRCLLVHKSSQSVSSTHLRQTLFGSIHVLHERPMPEFPDAQGSEEGARGRPHRRHRLRGVARRGRRGFPSNPVTPRDPRPHVAGTARRRRVSDHASGQGQADQRHLSHARLRELRTHATRPLLRRRGRRLARRPAPLQGLTPASPSVWCSSARRRGLADQTRWGQPRSMARADCTPGCRATRATTSGGTGTSVAMTISAASPLGL